MTDLKNNLIKKTVVLSTNKQEKNYLSLTIDRYTELKQRLSQDSIYVEISEFLNIDDKRNNVVEDKYTVQIQDLTLMGLRSSNKEDETKSIHRIKMTTELVEVV